MEKIKVRILYDVMSLSYENVRTIGILTNMPMSFDERGWAPSKITE